MRQRMLFGNPKKQEPKKSQNDKEVMAIIKQRRLQVLVHSFLYYELNINIIPDYRFDKFSNELAELQNKYPQLAKEVIYNEWFEGFEGGSGFNLPIRDPEVMAMGRRLLRSVEYMKGVEHNEKRE